MCCPECFGDRGLKKSIFPSLEPSFGACGYCGTRDVFLIEPKKLAPYFELVIGVYEPSEGGKLLVDWMREDWTLFSNPVMDPAHAKDLLGDILNDGELARRTFRPSPTYRSDGLLQWETLRDEMMYRNRWFLNVTVDSDRLRRLFSYLIAEDLPTTWFRARLTNEALNYSIEKMGAPPKRDASHGRANPAGIPYLYLGSLPETAVSEIRPHTGDEACVADFVIPADLKAVDLRAPRQLVSPFLLSDADEVGQLRADIPFLERLGEELTRPVLPAGAAIDYIPSQYLCEMIKTSNYDGVVYRSSVSDGINLAVFDPVKAIGGNVERYAVSKVGVQVEKRKTQPGEDPSVEAGMSD